MRIQLYEVELLRLVHLTEKCEVMVEILVDLQVVDELVDEVLEVVDDFQYI